MVFMTESRMNFSIQREVEGNLITEEKKDMKENNLKSSKQKMDQMKEENQKLKLRLSQVMEDYHSLKMQFNAEDNQPKKSETSAASDDDDESEFVSLSLGRLYNTSNTEETKKKTEKTSNVYEDGKNPDGLDLGLDCKFLSDNSADETLSKNESDEKGNNEASKVCREDSPKNSRSGDDEILQHSTSLKKPRVSVRAFCNTQTMNDGCQWRKYGQKIAKGNPCPRAYYRCTVSSSCPVRKQVQRCVDDMTILTTTYEGTHNHPLPPSATTMASTTSAAAAMLNCTSSSSTSPLQAAASTTTTGFNFAPSNNLATSRNFPNITISSTQSHPTVILDLTTPNHYSTHTPKFSSSSTLFSNALSSSTSLNFSNYSCFDPNNAFLKNMSSSYSRPFAFDSNIMAMASSKQAANDEKIAAATKAITNNPSFQTALAAAITSFVGSKVQGRNSSGLDFQLSFSQPSDRNPWEQRQDKLF